MRFRANPEIAPTVSDRRERLVRLKHSDVATSAIPEGDTVTAKKTPAPQRAGTRTKQRERERLPQWMVERLAADPALLREVAELVRESVTRSRSRRR